MKIFKEINPRFFAIFIRNQIFQLESNSIRILTYEDLPRESSTNHSTENARCWKGILFDIQHFHRIFFPTEIYLHVYFSANVYNINIISLSNTSRPFRRWRRKFRFLDQQGGRGGGEPIQREIEFLWWISEDTFLLRMERNELWKRKSISLFQTIVMYPRPNVITCTVRVWLREIGFSLTYGALMLKTWRWVRCNDDKNII